MENVLEVKNVCKKYGKKQVIDNISFSIKKGEIVGFLGPNGAGKTTIIKMIMGLVKITKGNINICNYDISKQFEKAAEKFGGIIEEPVMYSEFSAIDNLKIFSKIYKNVTDLDIKRVLKQVGLEGREKEPIKNYSLGMRQRLGLAQAIIHKPELLILDEPTNGLDPEGIIEFRNLLKDYAKLGKSVFISSHMLSEMELICDKVYIIDKGKIIDCNNLNNIEELFTYLIETSDNEKALNITKGFSTDSKIKDGKIVITLSKSDIAKLNRKIIQKEIDIYTVYKENRNLENIYLNATNSKIVGEVTNG